ncbi:RHS repeat-associated core domain-containing protein [Streptomyces sp. NPDC003697]
MGYTIPGWLDEILDCIGVNFPNVDEDDYREMATSMREFAENFEGKSGDAHQAVTRILSSSQGWAVDAMEKHWSHVKAGHLDKIPELARLFAEACDVVADIIYGMKVKAEVELAAMAASVGISLGLAAFTGGLSALLGAAEITAMRQAVKRIVDEAADRVVDELISRVTEPVNAKLEKMVEDAVLDLADGAFSLPPEPNAGGDGGGSGKHAHGGGMQLASADGGSLLLASAGGSRGGGGADLHIDHVEFEAGAGKVARHGSDLHTAVTDPLERAKGHFGRTKGKDAFTRPFESMLEGALRGSEKAVNKVVKHLSETVPERVKATSRLHRGNDIDAGRRANSVRVASSKPGGGTGHHGAPASGRNPDTGLKIDSSKLSQQARELNNRPLCGDPIDMSSGQMVLAQTDADLPGILPLILRRTHLSGYDAGRFFGPSWASTLDERLEENHELGGIWWYREDGSVLVYPRRPDLPGDRVEPAEGIPLPLTYVTCGTTYVLTVQDHYTGLTRHFEPSFTGDGLWWLSSVEDRHGNTITVERTGNDTPTAVTHSGGYRLRIDSDTEQGRVSALHLLTDDGPVRLRTYRYDGVGDLTETRNAVDAPLHLTYDTAHRITRWRDSNETAFTYVYDGQNRVTATYGSSGFLNSRITYAGPDQDGTTTATYTDSVGHATTYRSNRRGQVVSVTDPLGHTTLQQWDRFDRLLSRTDPLGRATRREWDEHGDLVEVTGPDGSRTVVRYNAMHLPVELTGPDGGVFRQEFDHRGNRTAVTTPDGGVIRYTYHPTGAVATVTDPLNATTTVETDPAGLPTAISDPLGARSSCRRDAFGRPVTLTNPLGATTSQVWDPEGNLLSRTGPDGSMESWAWDGEGNCVSHTDANHGTTTLEYGPFSLLTARTTPDGVTYRFAHDTELRLSQVTDPQGLNWTYVYDAAGRLVSETDFDGRTTAHAYDAAGQPATRTTPSGDVISYVFDEAGRLAGKTAGVDRFQYRYDPTGRLTFATGPGGQLELRYDDAGRLLTQNVDGHILRFDYDAAGRRISRTTPDNVVTSLEWDPVGNRRGLTINGTHTIAFTHDRLGRENERRIGEHVRLASAWDPAGRLQQLTLTAQAGPTAGRELRSRAYSYRGDGFLTTVHEQISNHTTHYTLDPLGRPLAATGPAGREQYGYDRAGNQTSAAWPDRAGDPDARGERRYSGTRLVRAGNTSYRYDAAGRLIERTKKRLSRKADVWRYTWDAEGRLTSCTTPDGAVWRYRYDPLGRRNAKYRLGEDGTSVTEEARFTWDGTRLAEQTDTRSGVTLTWEYEGHRPLAQYERKPVSQEECDSRFFAIVTDLIGTPTELVSEDGDIVWHTRTSAWGTTAVNADATTYTPLRYPGQYADPETGLHSSYFRHYDPETARFISPDPLGLAPAPNPVAYVPNAQTWLDPLGLTAEENLEWLDPADVNFSQRTVSPNDYVEKMRNGEWDWTRPGTALRVMEVDGQLVTYDNRRLDAAREVGTPVAVVRVNPDDPHPDSTTGMTWREKFEQRMTDRRNRNERGERVPPTGLTERPQHVRNPRRRKCKKS